MSQRTDRRRRSRMIRHGIGGTALVAAAMLAFVAGNAAEEPIGPGPLVKYGDPVPRDVRDMYDAGVAYLLRMQKPSGEWNDSQSGSGVTGMAMMVLLASGEDPNHGPYRGAIRSALKSMIDAQNPQTGFLGSDGGHDSMYQHGFGMLALAEAYGAVDDHGLGAARPIGAALELAVRAAVTSAKANPYGAWRYGPDAKDADTSVSGAVMMGLLAARNAGIEVPDDTMARATQYFASMTGPNGQVGYSGSPGGGSDAVTSIAVLVEAIARRKELPEYTRSLAYLKERSLLASSTDSYPAYTRYYRAQALFQGDVEMWERWNAGLVRELKALQSRDGSFSGFTALGGLGAVVDTSLALLSLAVNYKFLPVYER